MFEGEPAEGVDHDLPDGELPGGVDHGGVTGDGAHGAQHLGNKMMGTHVRHIDANFTHDCVSSDESN